MENIFVLISFCIWCLMNGQAGITGPRKMTLGSRFHQIRFFRFSKMTFRRQQITGVVDSAD
jgi:hypothetical protein